MATRVSGAADCRKPLSPGGDGDAAATLENSGPGSYTVNIHLPSDTVSPPVGVYSKEMSVHIKTDTEGYIC